MSTDIYQNRENKLHKNDGLHLQVQMLEVNYFKRLSKWEIVSTARLNSKSCMIQSQQTLTVNFIFDEGEDFQNQK